MCVQVAKAAQEGSKSTIALSFRLLLRHVFDRATIISDRQVIADARRMTGEAEDSDYIPGDPKEFCNRIFHTCYMGTENSSLETRKRAKDLATAIGA